MLNAKPAGGVGPSFLLSLCLTLFALPAAADSRYVVVFKASSQQAGVAARAVERAGGAVERELPQIGVALASSAAPNFAANLARDAAVRSVREDRPFSLDEDLAPVILEEVTAAAADGAAGLAAAAVTDPTQARLFAAFQWNLRRIHAPEVWAVGHLGDPAVTVAVVDSGIDYEHTELLGKVDLGRSISLVPEDDALLAVLFPGAHPVADLYFRGTYHSAMIACNSIITACVAPNVTLIGVKVINSAGQTTIGRVIDGIVYAANVGADVINVSINRVLSRDNAEDRESIEAVHRAVAYAFSRGSLVVAEVGAQLGGHSGDDDPRTVVVPAQSGAMGVSSTDRDDQLSNVTDWGRSLVEIAAPGGKFTNMVADAVVSACSAFGLAVPTCARPTPTSPSRSIFLTGFPPTAPTVSGVAALVDSVKGGALKGHQLQSILRRTAEDIGPTGRDEFFGHGLVDALAAIEAADK